MSLVPVIFCQFKMPEKFQKNPNKNQRQGSFRNHRRRAGGGPPPPRRPGGAAPPLVVPPGLLGGGPHLWCPLQPIFSPRPGNPRGEARIVEYLSVPPSPRYEDRERQKTSSRHPAG